MKKRLLGAVALLLATAAFAQEKKGMVVIKGTMSGDLKGYNKIYIYTRTSNDSVEVKDGQYTFSFPFTEVGMRMLYPEYIKATRQMYQPFGILIAEPGTYYISSEITKGMQNSEVKGPQAMVLYRQHEKNSSEAYKKLNQGLASIYGDKWYMINEKNDRYEAYLKSRDSLQKVFLVPVLEKQLKEYPDSYASAFILGGNRELGSLEQKKQWLGMLSKRMQQSDVAQKFADYIDGLQNSAIGKMVNEFVLPDPQGKEVSFKSLQGKYILIDFWASWCAPCRQSFPHMREVYKKYKSDQFEIYSISIDQNKEAWLKAVKEEANPWLQSLDTKNISQKGFAVTGVPSTFLIDPQGKILAKEVGFDPSGNSPIESKIKELFEKNQSEKKVIPAVRMN